MSTFEYKKKELRSAKELLLMTSLSVSYGVAVLFLTKGITMLLDKDDKDINSLNTTTYTIEEDKQDFLTVPEGYYLTQDENGNYIAEDAKKIKVR